MESADLSGCHYLEACGGFKPRLAPRRMCERSDREETRGGLRTTENNTQRAFNDSILMLVNGLICLKAHSKGSAAAKTVLTENT